MAQKTKTMAEVAFLMSNRSPLTPAQKAKLKAELESGAVKVVHDKSKMMHK